VHVVAGTGEAARDEPRRGRARHRRRRRGRGGWVMGWFASRFQQGRAIGPEVRKACARRVAFRHARTAPAASGTGGLSGKRIASGR
jgi:hypothetical protein